MPSIMFFTMAWSGEIKRKRLFLFANYLISFAVYILAASTDKMILQCGNIFGVLSHLQFLAGFLFNVFLRPIHNCHAEFVFNLQAGENSHKKTQKRLVFIALLLAITASADFLPKFFNIAMYPYGYISMFAYISLVAYAIVKYRAFDIETVVHKTIIWLLSFSLIIVPVFLAYKGMMPYFKKPGGGEMVFWIFSFLITAFYLRVIQPRIDHLFQEAPG